jgi:NAD(P)-dependent dehydrogenase (short-subunit alcohol dehydrogenase family)
MQKPEVVVVTGASAGVGRAIVRRFAADGARIALLARGLDGLEGARREVEAAGGEALVLPTDVADAGQVEAAAAATEERFGRSTSGSTTPWRPCSRPCTRWSRTSTVA